MESSENYTTKKKVPFGIYLVLLINAMAIIFYSIAFISVTFYFTPEISEFLILFLVFIALVTPVIVVSIGLLKGREWARIVQIFFSFGDGIFLFSLWNLQGSRSFFPIRFFIPAPLLIISLYLLFNKKVRRFFSQNG